MILGVKCESCFVIALYTCGIRCVHYRRMSNGFVLFPAKIPKSAYAFSAHDLSASTPSAGDTLVFAQTMLNEDGVYSTTTGKFTAPCDGVYEFHATLVPSQANKGARIAFEADGIAIGNLNVYDNPEPVGSSYSVIARLQERTQVYLNVTAVETGFRFYEATKRMNTFSGHLISY